MAGENLPWWEAEQAAETAAARELVAEAEKSGAKPTFTPEDLAHIDGDAAGVDAELDAEAAAKAEQLRKMGASEDEVQRRVGKAGEPKEASGEPASISDVEAGLKSLTELRKSNPRLYWSEENQKLERELLQAKAEADGDAKLQALGAARAEGILAASGDADALTASFDEVFSELDAEAQAAVKLAVMAPVDVVRVASDADVELFATGSEAQAEAVKAWGRSAPKRLATLRERAVPILQSDPKWGAWFDKLPAKQAVAVLDGLSR